MDSSMVSVHTVNLHEEYMYAIESSIVRLLAYSGVALHVICRGTVVPPQSSALRLGHQRHILLAISTGKS